MGNDAWIISHHEELFDKIGFRPSTKYALFNGSLECEFRKYQIFDGKLKERREEGLDIKTDEERRRNLKFKPHKKNEDGEWDDRRQTNDEEHYFKSKPFKDRDRSAKELPYEEEKDRKWGKDSRWKLFEAEDEEEAEIINRHLGKWGDRTIRANKGKKRDDRGDSRFERGNRDGEQRERFTDRESRQEARKSFFAGKGTKDFGERRGSFEGRRGERDERRPRRDDGRPARKFDRQKGEGRPFRDRKDGKK